MTRKLWFRVKWGGPSEHTLCAAQFSNHKLLINVECTYMAWLTLFWIFGFIQISQVYCRTSLQDSRSFIADPPHLTLNHGLPVIRLSRPKEVQWTKKAMKRKNQCLIAHFTKWNCSDKIDYIMLYLCLTQCSGLPYFFNICWQSASGTRNIHAL